MNKRDFGEDFCRVAAPSACRTEGAVTEGGIWASVRSQFAISKKRKSRIENGDNADSLCGNAVINTGLYSFMSIFPLKKD